MSESPSLQSDRIRALDHPRPVVAIVGRPNVGKSTLFNRLVQSRWAITDDQPGVTRDRLYAGVEWAGRRFTLADTGGYVPHSKDAIEAAVRSQAEQAIEEADVVLLVCDARAGLTDLDREVAGLLLRRRVSTLVVANKLDHPEKNLGLDELHGLGLGEPVAISAATGRRTGDLLDALVGLFKEEEAYPAPEEDRAIKIVLTGRPNVGKSTLINHLAGYQVSIVHDQPGTTRDTTQIRLAWKEAEFLLMDTAGLRRRARIDDPVEYYSGRRALDSIGRADVAVLLIDAVEAASHQDARIAEQVLRAGCGLVLAVNKWDLVEAEQDTSREFVADLHARYPFLADYPVIFVSALTGKRVHKCLETAARIQLSRTLRVPTPRLNRLLQDIHAQYPPSREGKEIKFYYATQHASLPPTFAVFSNYPELLNDSYKRYVEKKLREEFGFEGTPLRIHWRKRRGRG